MEVVVKIDNDKFREFKSFINQINGEIINSAPEEVVVSSVEEVRKRIYEAEKGEFVSEKEEKKFFDRLDIFKWSEK
jgi:hypothetical protein